MSIGEKKEKTAINKDPSVLDVPSVVMSKIMPIFTLEMDDWATYSPDAKNAPVDVAMELYEKVLSLKRLYDQRGPK